MNVDPSPKPLFFGQSAICYLYRHLTILFPPPAYKNSAIRPPAIPVNNSVLTWELGMRLYEQRFKEALIGLDLALKLIVFLRAKAWLFRMWHDVI